MATKILGVDLGKTASDVLGTVKGAVLQSIGQQIYGEGQQIIQQQSSDLQQQTNSVKGFLDSITNSVGRAFAGETLKTLIPIVLGIALFLILIRRR